jgi:hypothetical protein
MCGTSFQSSPNILRRQDMKRITLLMIMFAFIAVINGCLYAKVKTPLDFDADKTEIGTKVGTSSIQSILWLVAWGDGSSKAAAKNGNISVIHHMDHEAFNILFVLYSKNTTIVYGE